MGAGRRLAAMPSWEPSGPVAHLVLDIGGVLFAPALPPVLADVAAASGRDIPTVTRYVRDELAEAFWSGRIGIPVFWERLTAHLGIPGHRPPWWDDYAAGRRTPLPAASRVPDWAARVPVGILSNQRHEWALPLLGTAGLQGLLDPVLISSETGRVKPDPAAFRPLTRLGVPADRVLYVDDRTAALDAARSVGLRTLRADPRGTWADAVDAALEHRGGAGARG